MVVVSRPAFTGKMKNADENSKEKDTCETGEKDTSETGGSDIIQTDAVDSRSSDIIHKNSSGAAQEPLPDISDLNVTGSEKSSSDVSRDTDKKVSVKKKNRAILFFLRILQGALVGLGAVLPGISGGVLCVVFGIYRPIMEVLSNPFKKFRKHLPLLAPVLIGVVIGFLGVAKLLAFFLEKYPSQSVCLFVGLIAGMVPSLWREAGEKGRSRASVISLLCAGAVVFTILTVLKVASAEITPNFGWYIFCGFCLALSVIAPGMSFSTLLMPLGLYTVFVSGIGNLDFGILIPAGIGALVTVILLSKGVNYLFEKHYSVAFHAIVGIVVAATVMIIPFSSFAESVLVGVVNTVMLVVGVAAALLLDRFNTRVMSKQTDT